MLRINWSLILKKWFQSIFDRLQGDPQNLWAVHQEIQAQCTDFNYPLPYIESFDQIQTWDQLLELLQSLADKENSAFQFEFFCAAIAQYIDRL